MQLVDYGMKAPKNSGVDYPADFRSSE